MGPVHSFPALPCAWPPYDDPKAFDDTPAEAEKYDERSQQIAREMLYIFSKAKEQLE